MSSPEKERIVFLGVDVDLFKTCFFNEDEAEKEGIPSRCWEAFDLVCLDDKSTASDLASTLEKPGVLSVVFQDTELEASLLAALVNFYNSGGLVVFFGIYGEFQDPTRLANIFGFPGEWTFSAYTKHDYEVTYEAMDYIGPSCMHQEYSKSNLLRVPIQDRWMVAKAQPLHQYINEHAGSLNGEPPDEEWKQEAEEAKADYIKYCEEQYQQCPLAVHKNPKGGRLAYLGFVNGDGKIPKFVRSLVTRKQIPSFSPFKGWY